MKTSKTKKWFAKKRMVLAAGILSLLFALLAFPVQIWAADGIESLDIKVDLQKDGSAQVTEVCEVTIDTGTEYYLAFPNLDNEVISNFSVTDETGKVFEDVGQWDSSLSREEKAGKSGLITTDSGYELCWGFGSYGMHTYTLKYNITNVVKGYPEADMMTQVFVPEGANNPQRVHISIGYSEVPFTQDNTGVWVFGFSADYSVKDGKIEVQSDQAMTSAQFAGVMAEFNKGMFEPTDVRSRSVEDVKSQAFEGSDYKAGFWDFLNRMGPYLISLGIFLVVYLSARLSRPPRKKMLGKMKPEYKDPPYSREIPFGHSLPATYARLDSLNKLPNEGVVIGAYLLKWIRSGQVEVLPQADGKGKEKSDIRLRGAHPEMEQIEKSLYDMLIAAAGPDAVLQTKEFEKWSRKNFSKVQSWLERYNNLGMQHMRQMGAIEEKDAKMWGVFSYKETTVTPAGETLTINMFGFKKYLEDFTIVNEREAKEVQLWDDYLVFAQLFGIAEVVAKQFEALYPAYFRGVETGTSGGAGMSAFDMYMLIRISNSFGYAMNTGYHAGYNAHNTRYSGGGGHSSFGGGGGFSGGGGGGGMGSR